MAKCRLVALTNPLPGKEAEYNDWYQNTHLPEVIALPGGVQAQRFKLVAKLMGSDENQNLAIYEFECDNPAELLGAFGQAAQSGKMTPGTAQDMATCYTALFVENGEVVKSA